MIILGINDSHDASAAILIDGKLIVAVAEERIQRIKGTAGFPIGAIKECFRTAKIDTTDIDIVAFGTKFITPNNIWNMSSTLSIREHISLEEDYYYPNLYADKNVKLTNIFPDYKPLAKLSYPYQEIPFAMTQELNDSIYTQINNMRVKHTTETLNIDKDQIKFFDHHSCHAYYAYYNSVTRDKDLAIVTADAGGDFSYSTIHKVINGKIFEIHRNRNNLIGKIYSSVTLLLGMKPNLHEFKVMGLAPYASSYQKNGPREVFDAALKVKGFDFIKDNEMIDHYQYFNKRLKGYRFDGIAGALQDHTEKRLSEWFENISNKLEVNDFIFSGGVANNIKANKTISERNFVNSLFIPAAPSDENLSIGACFMAFNEEYGHEKSFNLIKRNLTAFWGSNISKLEINSFTEHPYITKNFHLIEDFDYSDIAEILANDEIIALCFEKMEFGSRALGHRSIIADPSNPKILKKINNLIKKRDFWMPFTPSIIDYKFDEYVINLKELQSQFMTMSFDTTDLGKKHLISAIHPYDQSVRPQIVSKETCERFYMIIDQFHKKTGIGAVLNTSLNIHGKPIINKPIDIINEILLEGIPLNYILINDILFIRK